MSELALDDIQLLIFDLDGTLIDSKTDLVLSVNAMRKQMGLPRLDTEVILSFVGRGVATLVRRALGDAGTQADVERGSAIFLDRYHRHMLDNTALYPGVREALDQLGGRRMAVLTNKRVDFSQEILAGLNAAHYFSWVYGDTSFPQKKPNPVGIFKMLSETGIAARQTMMIGDSDTDVLTGRNAGVWTCGVTYGFGSHTLQAVAPDLLLGDLRELAALLNGRSRGSESDQSVENGTSVPGRGTESLRS